MHDLCLLDHLDELREMGVASLKIEGRLKSASWVSRAVSLYRKALDGLEPLENLHAEAAELGNYTGRTLSSAYYSCHFDNLTDEDTGRRTTQPTEAGGSSLATPAEELSSFQISVHADSQRGTCFDLRLGICRGTFRLPWQRIATPKRATTLGEILREAESALPNGLEREISCPAELARTLLPRRCAGTLLQEFQEFLRRATKEDDGQVRIALPPALAKQLASPAAPAPANCRPLNDSPDCIRLDTSQINYIQLIENKQVTYNIKQFIVACSGNFSLEMLWNRLPDSAHGKFLLALPPVIYESALPRLQKALTWAKSQDLLVEVNSWDTLQLAREANVNFVAGPGLAVLNALSADFLHQFGAAACAVSPEIDEEKFAELCQNCAVPLTATVFSRPALMTTRAELPLEFAPQPDGQPGVAFEDSRGTRLCAWRDDPLTILRPESPFDWRRLSSPRIRVAHLVVDLSGSPDPMHDLASLSSAPFLFNFDRTLK